MTITVPVSVTGHVVTARIYNYLLPPWASLVTQMVKNLPAVQETQVKSLSWEDTLEKAMATHSRIPAQRITWTEEPGRLQSTASQRVRHN